MTNDDIMLFDTIRWILKKDYNVCLSDVLNKVKVHLEEEYIHYENIIDTINISKRIEQQNSRYTNINKIKEWLSKSKF